MPSHASTQFAKSYGTLLLTVSIEPKEIGQRVARARERKGWTQMQFAIEANVSLSSVQRWESGKLPPVRELMRVADVLEIATEELVEPEEQAETLDDIRARLAAEVDRFAELNARLERRLRGAGERSRVPGLPAESR